MPAQGQKSWDNSRRFEGVESLDIAMPAQGQKSWDAYTLSFRNACPGAEILGRPSPVFCMVRYRDIAMPAQGQKSWDCRWIGRMGS